MIPYLMLYLIVAAGVAVLVYLVMRRQAVIMGLASSSRRAKVWAGLAGLLWPGTMVFAGGWLYLDAMPGDGRPIRADQIAAAITDYLDEHHGVTDDNDELAAELAPVIVAVLNGGAAS